MTEAPTTSKVEAAGKPTKMNSMLDAVKDLMDVENFIPNFLEEDEFEKTVKQFSLKSNCNKCYGRGYTAIQVASRNRILCKCLKKSMVAGAKAEIQRNAK